MNEESEKPLVDDLVCGMKVDEHTTHRSTHAGETFLFCSAGCKAKFDAEPQRYLASAKKTI